MFICFGLLTLSNSYDFYNNKHIPFIKEVLKQNEIERKMAQSVELVKAKFTKQGDSGVHSDRRSDILDTSLDTCNSGDSDKSVVLDSSIGSDSILGGSTDASSSLADSSNIGA
jgi:hypothetical protein